MSRWGRITSRVAIIGALVGLTACGRYSADDKTTSKTTTPNEIGVGVTLAPSATTGVSSGPKAAAAAPTRGATAAPSGPCAANSSEGSADGLKLSLSVSKVCVTKGDDITFTFKVTNTTGEVVHYDKDQIRYFTLKAPPGENRRSWEDDDCHTTTTGPRLPAGALAPGQSVTVTGFYPAPSWEPKRDTCRMLEVGDYDARAAFDVCGPAAYAGGFCTAQGETQYFSTPIRITVRA